jgi:hypothetical protein
MPLEKTVSKTFNYPFEKVYEAAYLSIKPMGGKVVKNDPDNKQLYAQMDKKLFGKVLGDRSMLEVTFNAESEGSTRIDILAYPLNAIWQKLMFGARPGVVETVISAFFIEIDKYLETK